MLAKLNKLQLMAKEFAVKNQTVQSLKAFARQFKTQN